MLEVTRIIAIRHGETAWNVDTRIQGQLDVPLNDVGRWQAGRAAARLAGEDVQACYASDLSRAFATAEAIALGLGLTVQPDRGLRERSFGTFEGLTWAEIETTLPEQARLWRARDPLFAPQGGESLVDFRARVLATVSRIAAAHAGQQILLVAHGGVMDVLYRAATGQELQAPRTWALGNAAINRLLWTPDPDHGGLSLVGWGDTAHMEAEDIRDESST